LAVSKKRHPASFHYLLVERSDHFLRPRIVPAILPLSQALHATRCLSTFVSLPQFCLSPGRPDPAVFPNSDALADRRSPSVFPVGVVTLSNSDRFNVEFSILLLHGHLVVLFFSTLLEFSPYLKFFFRSSYLSVHFPGSFPPLMNLLLWSNLVSITTPHFPNLSGPSSLPAPTPCAFLRFPISFVRRLTFFYHVLCAFHGPSFPFF